jgi:hypothetical protein
MACQRRLAHYALLAVMSSLAVGSIEAFWSSLSPSSSNHEPESGANANAKGSYSHSAEAKIALDADAALESQQELVSPIIHRELFTMVKAPSWPFTYNNIACEAWGSQSADWEWMDRFVEASKVINSTDDQGNSVRLSYKAVTELVLQVTEGAMNKAMLEYSLSLRAKSPLCELHRGLARAHTLQDPALMNQNQQAFVVQEEDLLPDERPRGDGSTLQVLYANMDSWNHSE